MSINSSSLDFECPQFQKLNLTSSQGGLSQGWKTKDDFFNEKHENHEKMRVEREKVKKDRYFTKKKVSNKKEKPKKVSIKNSIQALDKHSKLKGCKINQKTSIFTKNKSGRETNRVKTKKPASKKNSRFISYFARPNVA